MTTDLERRLAAALLQEAETAMTLTDTPHELQRFRDRVSDRSRRGRIALAAAASVVLAAGAAFGVAQLSGDDDGAIPTQQPTGAPAPQAQALGDPRPLPASLRQTVLAGPVTTGDFALGSLWATSSPGEDGFLYRVSSDGARVLSRTPLDGVSDLAPSPTRVGSRIVVAKGDRTGFDVFDPTGNKVGTVPATAAGAAAGDSSGGWLVTANDTLTRVDAAGRPAGQPVQLPNKSIASIAVGGGSLWVLEGRGTLSRLDPATGEVTGSVDVQVSQGLQVVWTRGAAFVASADYDLKRVDSATMKVTAVLAGHRGWSFQVLTVAADGSLWTEPAKGAIAQVDDKTLGVITFTSAFPNDREGGAFGAAISGDRVFLTDGDAATLHSFPLS